MKTLVLSAASILLFQVNLQPQSVWEEVGQVIEEPQGLEYVVAERGRAQLTPIDTVTVDAVTNSAIINPGTGCGGGWAAIDGVPEGRYVIAISGGPGVSFAAGSAYTVGCFVWIAGDPQDDRLYGLTGYGSKDDPRSYILFTVPVAEIRNLRLCVADLYCDDNSGYVDVTLYQVGD